MPVDCDHPDPKVGTPECASGGFSVLLDNEDGDDEATFVVNGTNVVVPAGDSVTHPIAAAEGATVHITVTAGGVTLLDDDFTRECEAAVASLSVECARVESWSRSRTTASCRASSPSALCRRRPR